MVKKCVLNTYIFVIKEIQIKSGSLFAIKLAVTKKVIGKGMRKQTQILGVLNSKIFLSQNQHGNVPHGNSVCETGILKMGIPMVVNECV